jgi:hypothetical protein
MKGSLRPATSIQTRLSDQCESLVYFVSLLQNTQYLGVSPPRECSTRILACMLCHMTGKKPKLNRPTLLVTITPSLRRHTADPETGLFRRILIPLLLRPMQLDANVMLFLVYLLHFLLQLLDTTFDLFASVYVVCDGVTFQRVAQLCPYSVVVSFPCKKMSLLCFKRGDFVACLRFLRRWWKIFAL